LPFKIDLHIHTYYSHDSTITPKELVTYAKQRGLDAVAITDHDTIEGALKLSGHKDFLIIPGVEVSTQHGHVLGLNISNRIPSMLDVPTTIQEIHEAGGIAIAAHPTALYRGNLRRFVTGEFDAVEVINSSAIPFRYAVKQSMKIASRLGKPRLAGSDAHYGPEIGCAYTVVNAEPNVDDLVKAISKGLCQPFGNSIPWAIRLKRIIAINRRRL
jgi:predicted metal-dependent phosphoesterase TrpH